MSTDATTTAPADAADADAAAEDTAAVTATGDDAAAAAVTTNNNTAAASSTDIDTKIMNDLDTVVAKMDLLKDMLSRPGRHGIDDTTLSLSKNDDALLTIVGFLEACAPRLIELVEAASSGALSSETTLVSSV